MSLKNDHNLLLRWYKANRRELPWRQNQDPYRIWISEVMLQQTTVAAVIPYYEKFLKRFPHVQSLAQAPLDEVLEYWAGLGYYSRARNLHRAAQALTKNGFPKTAAELLALPGFGPYTSRAVASIAFEEPVGVLDGNVIRVLTRRHGLKSKWWETKARTELQNLSDELAQMGQSHMINQGLMELGATVCTPQKPLCSLCPWAKECLARARYEVDKIPLKKPRRSSEVWVWQVVLDFKKDQVGLIKNNYAPFLKGQYIFPGAIKLEKKKPTIFDVKHSITHHDIFVQIQLKARQGSSRPEIWVPMKDLKKINPSSLLQKILKHADK